MNDLEPDGGVYLVDEDSGAMYIRREWGNDGSLMMNIVAGLAEVTGKETDEIEPIQDKIDVDAVESLFRRDGRLGDATGVVSFEHEGQEISISSDGSVVFQEPKR